MPCTPDASAHQMPLPLSKMCCAATAKLLPNPNAATAELLARRVVRSPMAEAQYMIQQVSESLRPHCCCSGCCRRLVQMWWAGAHNNNMQNLTSLTRFLKIQQQRVHFQLQFQFQFQLRFHFQLLLQVVRLQQQHAKSNTVSSPSSPGNTGCC